MPILPLFPSISSEQWSAFGTGLTAWATVALAIAAFFGLRQWRTQLTGTSKYEIARRLALLGLQFRDECIRARSPGTFRYEYIDRPKDENESSEETRKNDEYYARRKRLVPLAETLNKMKTTSWEAEIILGNDVKRLVTPFEDILGELNLAIDKHFHYQQEYADMNFGKDLPDISEEEIRKRQKLWRTVYSSSKDDELNQELDEVTESLKQYLQTFIK